MNEELTKVYIDVPDNDQCGSESLWVKALGDDLYEIRSSPWFAKDLNWGDVVKAIPESTDLKPSVLEVVRRSGHKTLRVIFFDKSTNDDEKRILEKLRTMQASHENAWPRFYSIDVEPDADYGAVCDYLWALEQDGWLEYETGATTE
jgi:hypothetical protein